MNKLKRMAGMGMIALLAGCASLQTPSEVQSVGAMVQERTGAALHWKLTEEDAKSISRRIDELLEKPLTADSAVQVAMLGSPRAQRMLDQLDVAVAERTQAGLLSNPMLEFAYLKPREEGRNGLEFGLGFELLGALTLPVRERVAQSEYEAGKLQAAESLVAFAAEVRRAYYEAQASRLALDYWWELAEIADATTDLAESMRKAGNLSALKQQRQQYAAIDLQMQVAKAEVAWTLAREKLNRLMGLPAKQADAWRVPGVMQELPAEPLQAANLEQRVLEANLRMQATRKKLDAQAERLGLARNTSFLPELDAGYAWNREVGDGAWNDGPSIGIRLPLFDTGAARRQKLMAILRSLERDLADASVALRTETRSRTAMLDSRLQAARQAEKILGPLAQRISEESVLHFNAMQIGLFELLQDRQRQTEIVIRAIEAARDYWIARNEMDSLLSGVYPDNFSEASSPRMSASGAASGGH